ncbi:MAG TPA: ABC transporter permease [Candidatus Hydrogenedentes bacterium]|nr:ABC transporter permease [Candidatus Hydrogenedentota bacterium]
MSGTATGFFPVLIRELKRMVSRPLYLLLIVGFPMTTFGIMTALFYQAVPRDLPIAVCDQDNSSLSRRLIRWADATPSLRVAYTVQDTREGERLMNTGEAYALILIPEDLQRNVYRGTAPNVILYYNNQYMLTGSMVQRDLTAAMLTLSTGINIQVRQKRGEMRETALNHALPIQVDNHMLFNPYFHYGYYLLTPLFPSLLQLFIIITTVFALGIELREGSSHRWLACAGGSVVKAIAGKLFPYSVAFFLVGWLMNALLFNVLGLPRNGDERVLIAALAVYVLAYQSLGICFLAVFANLRMALSVGALFASPAFAFSGASFPVAAMPLFGRIWSQLLPVTHYLKLFIDQSLRGAPIHISLPALEILALFACIGPLLMLPRMKHVMEHEHHWGHV